MTQKKRKMGKFDVVTYDPNGYVFYEAKFRKIVIDDKMIEKEIKQVNSTGLNCYKYVFISRSGFKATKREDVSFIELKDFFKDE